jgi:hypothetical protein
MENQTSVTIITATAIIGFFVAVMHGCHETEETERTAMKAGLVQKAQASSVTIDTLIAPGFGVSFSKQLFERLPKREEDCIIDELIAEREKVLAEMKNERGME